MGFVPKRNLRKRLEALEMMIRSL